jgi:multiple sugar transport system permease protein
MLQYVTKNVSKNTQFERKNDIGKGPLLMSTAESPLAVSYPSGDSLRQRFARWWDNSPRLILLAPTIVIVLLLSIYPLIRSLMMSFSRVSLVPGGFQITFSGLVNYQKLLVGSEQRHVLGKLGELSPLAWVVGLASTGLLLLWLYRYVRSGRLKPVGFILRVIAVLFGAGLVWLSAGTLSGEGLPGTLVVTLIYVVGGVFFQYTLGLGLALLVTQNLPGKRFFRVVFLLPMTITPVGIGFLFRMMTDTLIGPFSPAWKAAGLVNFSWISTGSGARTAVMIGDIWQWTPFMFIILLAALEGVSREQIEAALVDGASRWQTFRYIVLPEIAPVSLTVVLIRLIEAFKIIDMPRILTGGGPGTATESLTFNAYNQWKASASGWGESAALSYILLIVVTFVAVMFVNVVRNWVLEKL